MHQGLGHQSEHPPRPRWEWWKYPANWTVLALLGVLIVAALLHNPLWWIAAVVLVSMIAVVVGLYRNDCR